ncbi:MAG: DegT/DnrJ/EryC1/StrS family aminotransferase [Castellaniella sp.]|uniref:DegT/DnrJ/EryC1/StrS family aminotransferase n=1 Tax=Castellaniella sp. TaxID=1955812 RepID=UPI003C759981
MALERLTGRHWTYAVSGKAAIYHCLRAMNVSGAVVVPIYACESILVPIRGLGLEPVFADIDPDDLNLSFESFVSIVSQRPIDAVVVPSLYGNPADLGRFEAFCRDHGVVMIDDAAQSMGATFGDRCVGTYGDAGLFSFSPGKATAGHGGGFFWARQPYSFLRSSHPLAHRVKWLNFYYSRLRAYDTKPYRQLLRLLDIFAGRLDRNRFWNDQMEPFEEPILGGILHALFNGGYEFRNHWHSKFKSLLASTPILRMVVAKRGVPHPHKLVLIADSAERAKSLERFLAGSEIFNSRGYLLLTDSVNLQGGASIKGRVIELAIDESFERMSYQYKALEKFIKEVD